MHKIEQRDIQCSIEQAWHGKTIIADVVTPELATPYEVEARDLVFMKDGNLYESGSSILIASDDNLPVGEPYNPKTYFPGSIKNFWNVLQEGMGDTPYEIHSAGTVEDRRKVFASVKISSEFTIGGREFKEYLTLIDSFDKSTALTGVYSSVCVVCSNTVNAALARQSLAKAKHTAGFSDRSKEVANAIDAFAGTSAAFKEQLRLASEQKVTKDEARAFIMAVEARNAPVVSNGNLQKVARMLELFESGRGNTGETRLDAFQGITEFFTHESSNRKDDDAQYLSSEWGTSAATKRFALQGLADWDAMVDKGKKKIESAKKSMVLSS